MFFFLFVWGLSSHSRHFHSYGDVTITSAGLQIFTQTRHSCPVRFLQRAAPTVLRGIRIKWSSPRTRDTHTCIAERLRLTVELSLPVFTTQVCSGWDSNTQPFARGANAVTQGATTVVMRDANATLSYEQNILEGALKNKQTNKHQYCLHHYFFIISLLKQDRVLRLNR